MKRDEKKRVIDALLGVRGFMAGYLRGRGPLPRQVTDIVLALDRATGLLLEGSTIHDPGAYARCSFCKRYTASACSLSHDKEICARYATCACGRSDGWSGSFTPPDENSEWSLHLEGP